MSVADELIALQEANSPHYKSAVDSAPEGYYTDDMGYWVEQNIRQDKARFAEYILYRCYRLHQDIYTYRGDLYQGHTMLHPTVRSIVALADTPELITTAQAIWVYNRIKRDASELDLSRLIVGRNAVWDFEAAELIEESDDGIDA